MAVEVFELTDNTGRAFQPWPVADLRSVREIARVAVFQRLHPLWISKGRPVLTQLVIKPFPQPFTVTVTNTYGATGLSVCSLEALSRQVSADMQAVLNGGSAIRLVCNFV